jgi:hypothetical protein
MYEYRAWKSVEVISRWERRRGKSGGNEPNKDTLYPGMDLL